MTTEWKPLKIHQCQMSLTHDNHLCSLHPVEAPIHRTNSPKHRIMIHNNSLEMPSKCPRSQAPVPVPKHRKRKCDPSDSDELAEEEGNIEGPSTARRSKKYRANPRSQQAQLTKLAADLQHLKIIETSGQAVSEVKPAAIQVRCILDMLSPAWSSLR